MKTILFYIPYDQHGRTHWDGDILRTGNIGLSGTHQSFVIAAEAIAQLELFKVILLNYGTNKTIKGVYYPEQFDSICSQCDIVVIPNWMPTSKYFLNLKQCYKLHHIIMWYHCPYLSYHDYKSLLEFNSTKDIIFSQVHLSSWSQSNVLKMIDSRLTNKVIKNIIIPNPLIDDTLIQLYSILYVRPCNFVFHASFERGGCVASNVINYLNKNKPDENWGSLKRVSYMPNEHTLDKQGIYELLSKTRYFVYPLVLPPPSYSVHRDTFACCVAEAIAMGVEVFSYPIGALKEHYNDMIHWIPFPPGLSTEHFNDSIHDKQEPSMFSDEQVKVIAELVYEKNNTYHERQLWRIKNAKRVREMFSSKKIGEQWRNFINEMISVNHFDLPS